MRAWRVRFKRQQHGPPANAIDQGIGTALRAVHRPDTLRATGDAVTMPIDQHPAGRHARIHDSTAARKAVTFAC